MKRKDFLSTILPISAVVAGFTEAPSINEPLANAVNIPKYLKMGDTIGITCPAGHITLDELQPAINTMQQWGFKIKIGNTVGKIDNTYGGTDPERLADLQAMLDDENINAIMCGRGGYGAVRIIDGLSFKKYQRNPKWMIGFSDITVLHSHINKNYGIATIHSKMCNSFPADISKAEPVQINSIDSIRLCLIGERMRYLATPNEKNKTGIGEGVLVGGNLKTLETLAGSKSDIDTDGKILFVEDTGEYLYSIDRMFWNLKRSGKLSNLKALIIGGFKIKKDDEGEEFGRSLEDIVLEKIKEYNYPVCFDFPVGHQKK